MFPLISHKLLDALAFGCCVIRAVALQQIDLNSLVTRRMDKLNPNETYTVYKVDVPDEALTGEDEDILNYDDLDDPDAFV